MFAKIERNPLMRTGKKRARELVADSELAPAAAAVVQRAESSMRLDFFNWPIYINRGERERERFSVAKGAPQRAAS